MPAGTPTSDDPEIVQAMTVYDNLPVDEQREIFRTLYRAVAAFGRTENIDHLVRFAKSVEGMVLTETKQPGTLQAIRNAPKTVSEAGGSVDAGEVLKQLRR